MPDSGPMCNLKPPWQVSSQCAFPCLCIWGLNQAKEKRKCAGKTCVVMEPEGSSWVEKALGLLVFIVGLAAGARAGKIKMPQKWFLLLFLYLWYVALRIVPHIKGRAKWKGNDKMFLVS